jgi:plastocyanin
MHARTAAKPLALVPALLAALLLTAGLAACGDDDDTTSAGPGAGADTSTTAPAEAGSGDEVTIVAEDFSLTSVTAKPGEVVHLENRGEKPHTVTADDGSFDTGSTAAGAESELTAPMEPGVYAYHCSIHASMTGTLTVAA